MRDTNSLTAALAESSLPEPLADELRVRLVFDERADLDLYVTDPLQETVYFANSPSRSDGRIEADLRCGAPGPRIETVTFPSAAPGRYRIGVDFPERCDGGEHPVPFVVVARHGGIRRERRGTIARHQFQPIVLEIRVTPD